MLCIVDRPRALGLEDLLRAELDYEVPPPHLHRITDPIDDEGCVYVSEDPGLGIAYNWEYIDDNRI